LKELLPIARAAHVIAEADDLYFARAQRIVRRALLAAGPAPDVFYVPVGQPVRDPAVAAALSEQARRRTLVPPLRFSAFHPEFSRPSPGAILRGLGTCGRRKGRVGSGRDEVRVITALGPQNAHQLLGAAAAVTDYGGLLSHGATQAREYGVPTVLGTGAATRTLEAGDEVLVDADAGAVYLLKRGTVLSF
jgi:pyruvate,water dikinase